MRVASECAGFTPGEADQLRRAMATFKQTGTISAFGQKLIRGMVAKIQHLVKVEEIPAGASEASQAS